MKRIIFILICALSIVRVFIYVGNSNEKIYEEKEITGKIVNIKIKDDKSTIDIKDKDIYRVTLYSKENYELGDIVFVKGSFNIPSNNTIFNTFNYKKYLYSKNIRLVSNDAKIKLVSKNHNIFYEIKNKIIKHVQGYKSSNYLKTFVLADTSEIEEDIKTSYRNLGISHLLAVSGTHVAIFIYIINFIFKRFKYKEVLIIFFLLFFLFITNYSESLLRCFTFVIFRYINKYFKLGIKNIYLVLLTASSLLIIKPYLIYSIGFIFSITITFFIILSSDLLKDKNYIKRLFILSLISFLSSLPILASYFFKINLLSLLYNLLFVPLVSFVIFPFGLLTFMFPFLDDLYTVFINVFEMFIYNLDKVKILTFVIGKPNIIMILFYYVFLILFIKKDKRYIICYLVLLIVNINIKYFIFSPMITYLDVGQGDSIVATLPFGRTVMIDTGGKFISNYSIVINKTIPYLNSLGISKLDALVLTHGDYDHMGESINLVNNFKVDKVIFNCGEFNDLEKELIGVLDNKNINYYGCINELKMDRYKFYFLNNKIYNDENDNSIVLYTKFGDKSFLFMGDASIRTEKDLIEKYNLNDIDVLKVGHHGSKTSSGKNFIGEVKPKYGVISVGEKNRYGHPNKEVLNNLDKTKIYRTDVDGSVRFKIKESSINIKTCKP